VLEVGAVKITSLKGAGVTVLSQDGSGLWLTGTGTGTAGLDVTASSGATAVSTNVATQIQSGLSTLDAAGVRTSVGLASANLDTQLGDLPTAAENADALLGRTATGGANGGRSVAYFLQGGFNKAVRTSTAFTVYSTDDVTVLATGPLTQDGTLNPITAVDPT
jgi:hypothetical protein